MSNKATPATETNLHIYAPQGEDLKKLVEYYNSKGKLPTLHVTCTRTGVPITMFGDNLTRRIEKFGGIETLLTTFISKDALRADKANGIIHTNQPKSHRGGSRVSMSKLTPEQIDEQIRQLQTLKDAQMAKANETEAEAKVTEAPAEEPAPETEPEAVTAEAGSKKAKAKK